MCAERPAYSGKRADGPHKLASDAPIRSRIDEKAVLRQTQQRAIGAEPIRKRRPILEKCARCSGYRHAQAAKLAVCKFEAGAPAPPAVHHPAKLCASGYP